MRTFPHSIAALTVALVCLGLAMDSNATRAIPRRLPRGAPRLALLDATGVSEADARRRVPAHIEAITRCVITAQSADPVGLAAVEVALAVIRLRPDGRTDSVDIAPSDLARGLSACLAVEFLAWQQRAPVAPRAAVRLVVNLRP